MNPGKTIKFDCSLAKLRRELAKEEKDLEFWEAIQTNESSDELSKRQAKGNINGTKERITELKAAVHLLSVTVVALPYPPPKEQTKTE